MASDTSLVFNIIARDNASRHFSKLKAVAVASFAAIGVAAIKFGLEAGQAASDMAETQSKVNQIFGSSAGQIEAFASTAAEKLGQSKQAAMDAGAEFGIFGKAAGLTGKALGDFSVNLVRLSSDLASFSNTSPEQAAEALGAALRGEAEPMRAYGVLLNDASIKATALSMGLVKSSGDVNKIRAANIAAVEAQQKFNKAVAEFGPKSSQAEKASSGLALAQARLKKETKGTVPDLTQQQKIMATQAAIYAQTKDAQGDFSRTSGGLANQQRMLAAQLTNTKTQLGAALLPAMLQVTSAAKDMVIWFTRNKDTIIPVVAAFAALVGVIYVISAAVKAYTIIQAALNIVMALNPIGLIIAAIILAVGWIVFLATKTSFFQIVWAQLWGFLKKVGAWFAGPFVNFFKRAWGILSGLVVGYYTMVFNIWRKIFAFLGAAPGKIRSLAKNMWNGLIDTFRGVVNMIIGAWNRLDFGIHVHLPAALGGAGFDVDDVIPDIPYLAQGGIVRARPGGTVVLAGEGGRDEAVVPLPRGGGFGGGSSHVVIELRGADESFKRFFREILRKNPNLVVVG